MTNLLEQLGGQRAVEGVAHGLFSEYGWMLLAAVVLMFFKDVAINLAQGIAIKYSRHWRDDAVLYISGRQARIVRVGVKSTTFYMADRGTKMIVPNEKIRDLTIEKVLPQNGGVPYLRKGSDPDFVGNEVVPVPPEPMKVEVVEKPTRKRR
jgi:hypothetical protein